MSKALKKSLAKNAENAAQLPVVALNKDAMQAELKLTLQKIEKKIIFLGCCI